MHRIFLFVLVAAALSAQAPKKPMTLRDVLLEQLRTTHTEEDWFVPIKIAVEGLTPAQAKWTDGKGNHSVGQLVNHLAFWNQRNLDTFEGRKPPQYNGNN